MTNGLNRFSRIEVMLCTIDVFSNTFFVVVYCLLAYLLIPVLCYFIIPFLMSQIWPLLSRRHTHPHDHPPQKNQTGAGIGSVFGSLIIGYARNPSLKQQLFSYAILGFALSEAMGLFCLMMAFLLLFAF